MRLALGGFFVWIIASFRKSSVDQAAADYWNAQAQNTLTQGALPPQ